MNKTKRLAVVLFVLLLCIIFCSCSAQKDAKNSERISNLTTVKNWDNSEENDVSITATQAATTTTKVSTTKAEKESISTTKSSTTSPQKSTTKQSKTTNQSSTTKAQSTTNSQANSTTKANKATTKSNEYCYLTIECKSILTHIESLSPSHDQFVPSNGYITMNYAYKVNEKASVYDVLKKACEDNNIPLNTKDTVYGAYIAGINNIDEMDCGKYSGWTYYVNDEFPSLSCDKYNVKPGDKIIFSYVCERT